MMNRLSLLLFAAAWSGMLISAGGCRSARDNQLDLMERELRSQEDYIYELEDYVMEYSEKLRQCRCTESVAVAHNHHDSAPSYSSSTQANKKVAPKTTSPPASAPRKPEASILEDK